MAMKYVYENFVNKDEVDKAEVRGFTINVRFCSDCPFFDINGIQPDEGVIRGRCLRLSDEEVHHYIRVVDTDFCNEDHIKDEIF